MRVYMYRLYTVNGGILLTKIKYVDLQPPPIKRQLKRPKKKRNKDGTQLKQGKFWNQVE